MKHRGGTALVAMTLALAMGLSACGGGAGPKKPSAKAEAAAEARWRAGLLHWRRTMLGALNGISLILATDGSLALLHDPGSATSARLASFTSTLDNCSAAVERIGSVPAPFVVSRRLALVACKTLGQGDQLVAGVVVKLRHGGVLDTLDPVPGAGDLFSTGQNQLTTATRALNRAYSG
jgi:hypothetical protein